MKIKTLFFLFLCTVSAQAQTTLSGYIKDARNKEALPGATIFDPVTGRGTASNAYGFFSLSVPASVKSVRVTYVGFQPVTIRIDSSSVRLEILLEEQQTIGQDIIVRADRESISEMVRSSKMGSIGIKPVEVSRIATFGGESDMIKVLQLMPGVTPGNEGQTGMFVRGGTDDQNLILLDEAVVYNVAHLFGFFSVFNTDAISDVQLEKGPFAPRYGGRLSSVVDVRMKEGSATRWQATGGVGLLTSRLTLEGPLWKDKVSFMVSGRRTYIDRVIQAAGASLPYYFYDTNAKLNATLSPSDRVFISTYRGEDILDIEAEDEEEEDGVDADVNLGFKIGNRTVTSRWNHIYEGGKLFSNLTLHQTEFNYDIFGDFIDNSILIRSQINDVGLKGNWEYFPKTGRQIQFGFESVVHKFRPNVITTSGDINELIGSQAGDVITSTETAVYVADDIDLTEKLRFSWGLRQSAAFTGSTVYSGPEPRLSVRLTTGEGRSIKAGYSLMRQYMHRVSSSSIALPTDLWYPVTENVKPQHAHQVSLGYYGGLPDRALSFSVETYVKRMFNLIEYKEGARLILNDNFERELLNGDGRSFGMEWFIRKHSGRFTGWASYTLSRTDRQFNGLNKGQPYPDRFDRRHSVSVVGMLELAENLTFSFTWVYLSGTRITAQTGQFIMPNSSFTGIDLLPIYSSRNAVTLAPSHRLDVNFILKRPKRSYGQGEWHLSAYNFYNRAAPYRVNIQGNGAGLEYAQHGLFGFIPSIAYNFNFSYAR